MPPQEEMFYSGLYICILRLSHEVTLIQCELPMSGLSLPPARTSICFVTALYSAIGVSCMCIAFIYQFSLISQNVTSHELARARGLGMVACGGLLARENPNNRGVLRNWFDFWLSTAGRSGVDAYKEAL